MVARPRKAAAAAVKTPDFAALLADARLPERTVPICMRADLVAEHEPLEDELELLEKKAVDSLAGNGGPELAARINALEEQMRAAVYPFRVRALPGPKYRAFQAEHPVRMEDDKINPRDYQFNFNVETGAEALARMCVVDPMLDDEQWAELMQRLTQDQFEQLFSAAFMLNDRQISVPLSRAASRLTRLSGDDSKSLTD